MTCCTFTQRDRIFSSRAFSSFFCLCNDCGDNDGPFVYTTRGSAWRDTRLFKISFSSTLQQDSLCSSAARHLRLISFFLRLLFSCCLSAETIRVTTHRRPAPSLLRSLLLSRLPQPLLHYCLVDSINKLKFQLIMINSARGGYLQPTASLPVNS